VFGHQLSENRRKDKIRERARNEDERKTRQGEFGIPIKESGVDSGCWARSSRKKEINSTNECPKKRRNYTETIPYETDIPRERSLPLEGETLSG